MGEASDSAPIKGNQLDVESRVYVGGLPHSHTAKRINVRKYNTQIVKEKLNISLKSQLKG